MRFRNESNACLICNPENGKPLLPGAVYDTMYLLKKKVIRLLESSFPKLRAIKRIPFYFDRK